MLFEERCQEWQGDRRREYTGSTASAFLLIDGVGRGVAAKHELGVGMQRSLKERIAVFGALGDWFAEQMWLEQLTRHVIQCNQQMM